MFEYPPHRLFRSITLSRLTLSAAVLGAVIGGVVALAILGHSSKKTGDPPPAVVPVIGPTNAPIVTAFSGAPTASATSASPRPSASRAHASPSPSPAASRLAPLGYEGDASANILAGGARAGWCGACPDGAKIRFLGEGGTLTFPDVKASVAGSYALTITYTDGDTSGGRDAIVTVDGVGTDVFFTGDGDWNSPQTRTVIVHLSAGQNAIEFGNPNNMAPDIAQIVV